MGRVNKQWRHSIGIGIEVSAPDGPEASRRIEDVRDALQARFTGSEIYPPSMPGSRSRIPGSPRFGHFQLIGKPGEVDPFDNDAALTERDLRVLLSDDKNTSRQDDRIKYSATYLILLLRQSIKSAWIPNKGDIADSVEALESAIGEQHD